MTKIHPISAIFQTVLQRLTVRHRNGELKEYIAAGVPKDEFLRRIGGLLESRAASAKTPSAPVAEGAQSSELTAESSSSALPTEEPLVRENLSTTGIASSGSDGKEQKKEQKKSEKGKGKQKAESQQNTPAASYQVPEWEMDYALMQKKKQENTRNERARILKRVEDDKIERRKWAAARKAEANKTNDQSESIVAGSSAPISKASSQHKECALQIRLFDGSSIRSKFPSSATLRVDVRPWIDEHQLGNAPYTFKHILTPLPNRTISISDEEQSLQSQGLAPNATLILVPVHGYTTAYVDSGSSGVVAKSVSTGYGLISSGVGLVTGLFGSLLGGAGPAAPPQDEPPAPSNTAPTPSNINIRTLRDQNPKEDRQFYNGNAVSDDTLYSGALD